MGVLKVAMVTVTLDFQAADNIPGILGFPGMGLIAGVPGRAFEFVLVIGQVI